MILADLRSLSRLSYIPEKSMNDRLKVNDIPGANRIRPCFFGIVIHVRQFRKGV